MRPNLEFEPHDATRIDLLNAQRLSMSQWQENIGIASGVIFLVQVAILVLLTYHLPIWVQPPGWLGNYEAASFAAIGFMGVLAGILEARKLFSAVEKLRIGKRGRPFWLDNPQLEEKAGAAYRLLEYALAQDPSPAVRIELYRAHHRLVTELRAADAGAEANVDGAYATLEDLNRHARTERQRREL